MPNVNICICHPSEQHCQAIVEAFRQHDAELGLVPITDLRGAAKQVKEEGADVVVVGVDAPGDPALRTVAAIQGERGESPGIMVVSQEPSQELLVACMRAGCDEFLEFPIDGKELAEALARLYRKRGILQQASGKVTAVYGTKGGAGATTIAANLAVHLGELLSASDGCCILDLHQHFGSVALMMDVRQFTHSVADACHDADRLDAALLNSYMVRHESGAALLPAPQKVEDMADVEPAKLTGVIQQCQEIFEHVLLDLPHGLDALTLAGLDAADEILLVCDMMLPSIHNAKCIAGVLRELDVKKTKLKLILNRYYDSDHISLQEISDHVELPIYWLVPYDSTVAIAATNTGRTFNAVDDTSEAAKSMLALAQEMAGVVASEQPKKKFSLFGRK